MIQLQQQQHSGPKLNPVHHDRPPNIPTLIFIDSIPERKHHTESHDQKDSKQSKNLKSEKSKLSLHLIVPSNLTFSASDRQWFNMVLTLNPHNTLTHWKEKKSGHRKKKESEWFYKRVLIKSLSHVVWQRSWVILRHMRDKRGTI